MSSKLRSHNTGRVLSQTPGAYSCLPTPIGAETASSDAPGGVFSPPAMVSVGQKKRDTRHFPLLYFRFFPTKNGKGRLCIPLVTIP